MPTEIFVENEFLLSGIYNGIKKLKCGVPQEIYLVGAFVVVANLKCVLHLDVWVTVNCSIGSIDLERVAIFTVSICGIIELALCFGL